MDTADSSDILEIQADPAGATLVVGFDGFGAPICEYLTAADLDEALAWMAKHKVDRRYFSRIGTLVESDLLEMRSAVLRAQERHLQAEGYQDERGRG